MPDDTTQHTPADSQAEANDADTQAQASAEADDFQNVLEKEAASATAVAEEPLFEDDELRQFDEDDVTAGRSICKMLSLFFLYTVIVMAIAGYWTVKAILN